MSSRYLFPLLSGLLISGLTACGSSSSDDDVEETDTDSTGATDTETDTDTDTETDEDTDETDTETETDETGTDTEDTDVTEGDAGPIVPGDGGIEEDGGTDPTEGDGGLGDGGLEEDAGDTEPQLPEGACAEAPEAPENGEYVEGCEATLDGESCELVCDTNYVASGNATCTDGEWSEPTCVALGSLSAVIGDAESGLNLADADVYVKGFFDPEAEECAASDYCKTTNNQGQVSFPFFPSGPQEVVIVKDGFDEIALPVNIEPGSSQTVSLQALPTGFLDGNIVIVLGWELGGNLDLVVNVPGDDGQCVFFDEKGSLAAVPYAQLDIDARTSTTRGPETIRIALNADGTGPFYDGTYNVLVSGANRTLQNARPSVRLIREAPTGGAQVLLFQLPETAVEDATEWHAFDLHGDGSVSAMEATEAWPADKSESELPCVAEL